MVLSRRKKLWLIPALAALVIGGVTAGQAQAGPDGGIGVQDALLCDGGAQKRVFVRTDSAPTALAETGWTPVPGGMQVNFVIPNGEIEHVLMQFSAKAQLDNPNFPATLPTDSIQIAILINGVAQEPLLLDHEFNTDTGQSNMVQACRRLGPGNYTVTVEYLVIDTMPFVALTGELDGKALHVQISE